MQVFLLVSDLFASDCVHKPDGWPRGTIYICSFIVVVL
uniref:Uncharacterized protein n=1 Tax=Arundo donax TaxID=35708 RepID=A0A0A8Z0H5_ARUDO